MFKINNKRQLLEKIIIRKKSLAKEEEEKKSQKEEKGTGGTKKSTNPPKLRCRKILLKNPLLEPGKRQASPKSQPLTTLTRLSHNSSKNLCSTSFRTIFQKCTSAMSQSNLSRRSASTSFKRTQKSPRSWKTSHPASRPGSRHRMQPMKIRYCN